MKKVSLDRIYKFFVSFIDNPIAESAALALALIAAFYYFIYPKLPTLGFNEADLINFGNFIEWFGVPYGLLLAYVLVNVWTQYETTKREFDREADGILSLYNTCLVITDKPTQKLVNMILYYYVGHTKKCYAQEFAQDDDGKGNTLRFIGGKRLNWIRRIIGNLVVHKTENEVLTTELFRLINKIIDDRGDRIAFSRQRLPGPVLLLSFIASFLWAMPFFSLSFSNPFIQFLYLGGVTFVITSLLLIIVDLNDPFNGSWQIRNDSWEKLYIEIKNSLQSSHTG